MLALCWLAATSVFKHSFALTVTKKQSLREKCREKENIGGKKKVLFTSWRLRISIDCEKSWERRNGPVP
jgi:hypothetical protein